MEWNKLTNQRMDSLCLDGKNTFVVETLSLDHLSMVDSNSEQSRVHNLSKEKLNDMIIKLFCQKNDNNEPCQHVCSVSHNIMFQKHVSHHENQWHRKFNLKLVITRDCPFSKIFGLVGKQNDQNRDSIYKKHICPEMDILNRWIVHLVDQY